MGILKRLLTLLGFKLLYNHSIIFINKWLHSFSAAPQPQLMRWAWGLKGWDMLQVCRESCPGNFKAEQRCRFKADVCCLSYLAGNRSGAVLRDTRSEPPALLPSGSSDLQKPLTCVITFCQREPEVCAGKAGVQSNLPEMAGRVSGTSECSRIDIPPSAGGGQRLSSCLGVCAPQESTQGTEQCQ